MKAGLLLLFPVFSLLAGEPLDQGQRDFAMSHLHATRKAFLDSVANLSPAQWKYKPAANRWSIAECAVHIAESEDYIWALVEKLGAGPAASPEQLEKTKGKDQAVVKMVPDRSSKFQAPEPIAPKGVPENPQAFVEKFASSRDRHIAYVQTTRDSLRDKVAPHPAMGPLDAYQWILLISAHTERHTLQIQEVKDDPNFPKK